MAGAALKSFVFIKWNVHFIMQLRRQREKESALLSNYSHTSRVKSWTPLTATQVSVGKTTTATTTLVVVVVESLLLLLR